MSTDRRTRRWIERYARAGFLAKAVVYLVLGWLAAQVALGAGGRLTDARGVVRVLLGETHGRALVALLAVGLYGYALWRFLEAFGDANRRGRRAGALATRAGYAVSGIVYGALALEATRLVVGAGPSGGRSFTSRLAASDAGPVLVAIAGLGLLGYAGAQLLEAFRARLDERLALADAVRDTGHWIIDVCRVGIAARAIVFAGLGVLLLRGSSGASAAAETGTSESLRLLAGLPNGRWVLAGTAAGLGAYGIYQLVHARYRRIRAP